MVCGMSSTRVGVYIEGLGMKFVIFCNFFRIFWTPNDKKRLAHVDQSDRDTWTNQIAPRRSRPRSRPASASPPSRPPLARAGAPARARARRYRPLSPGASAIARRRPLARLSPARGRQRPLLARAAARTATSHIHFFSEEGFVASIPTRADSQLCPT